MTRDDPSLIGLTYRHEPADCIRAIKEVLDVLENANNSILDIYKTSEVSITSIKVSSSGSD